MPEPVVRHVETLWGTFTEVLLDGGCSRIAEILSPAQAIQRVQQVKRQMAERRIREGY